MLFIVSEPTLLRLPDTPLVALIRRQRRIDLDAPAPRARPWPRRRRASARAVSLIAIVAVRVCHIACSSLLNLRNPRQKMNCSCERNSKVFTVGAVGPGLHLDLAEVALPLQAVPRVVVAERAADLLGVVARRQVGRVERAVADARLRSGGG